MQRFHPTTVLGARILSARGRVSKSRKASYAMAHLSLVRSGKAGLGNTGECPVVPCRCSR